MEKKGKGILGVLKKILKVYLFVVILGILLGVISEITGIGESKGIPENVLDYLGTKDSEVYKTIDKSEFSEIMDLGWYSYSDDESGLPGIDLVDGQVYSVWIRSTTDTSYHINGLRCGDSVEQLEQCMNKLKASKTEDYLEEMPFLDGDVFGYRTIRTIEYLCRYKEEDVLFQVYISNGFVDDIFAMYVTD